MRQPLSPSIEWRRLDMPGHEAAQLKQSSHGWTISGTAAFVHDSTQCRLDYIIECDCEWKTQSCGVVGVLGTRAVKVDVRRSAGGEWSVDGAPAPALAGCEDIDLGFSPSTNLLPIRRLSLPIGASAAVSAAWVRFPQLTLEVLEQVYTRLAADRYLYESAGGNFRRELTVEESGFVVDYPDFWRKESSPNHTGKQQPPTIRSRP